MKKVTIDYKDNTYTLAFDRDSVRKTEQMGFKTSAFNDMPATMFPILFKGAFLKYHKRVANKIIEEIFDNVDDLAGLLEVIVDMYMDALNSMLDGEDTKNVKWTLS